MIDILKRVNGWFGATLDSIQESIRKRSEIKRRAEIEQLVIKLDRLGAIWRIPTSHLPSIKGEIEASGRDYIWEVDYNEKYIYGRKE